MHVRKVADSTERVYLGTYCDKCQNEKEAVLNQSLPILQNQKFLDKHTKFWFCVIIQYHHDWIDILYLAKQIKIHHS